MEVLPSILLNLFGEFSNCISNKVLLYHDKRLNKLLIVPNTSETNL